jgi:hypothetical protein
MNRTYRHTTTIITAMLVVLATLTAPSNATTTKKKKKAGRTTTRRPTTTKPAVTTTKPATTTTRPATTKPPGTTIAPLTQDAALAAYQRWQDVEYVLFVNPESAPVELPRVATADYLRTRLDGAKRQEGQTWTGKREEYQSFDVRIERFAGNEALIRGCVRQSAAPNVYRANGKVVPGTDKVWASDQGVYMQYLAPLGGWVVAKVERAEDVEGQSKCADGR